MAGTAGRIGRAGRSLDWGSRGGAGGVTRQCLPRPWACDSGWVSFFVGCLDFRHPRPWACDSGGVSFFGDCLPPVLLDLSLLLPFAPPPVLLLVSFFLCLLPPPSNFWRGEALVIGVFFCLGIFPGRGFPHNLHFLLCQNAFNEFRQWPHPSKFLDLCFAFFWPKVLDQKKLSGPTNWSI